MEFLLKKLQDIDVDAFQIAIRNLVLVVLLVKGDHFKLLMMSILSLAHEYGRSAEVLNLCLALAGNLHQTSWFLGLSCLSGGLWCLWGLWGHFPRVLGALGRWTSRRSIPEGQDQVFKRQVLALFTDEELKKELQRRQKAQQTGPKDSSSKVVSKTGDAEPRLMKPNNTKQAGRVT